VCVIGDMGLAQARILHNYAKRMVLPVLGLQGNYKEPDLKDKEILGEGSGTQQNDNCDSDENSAWKMTITWMAVMAWMTVRRIIV